MTTRELQKTIAIAVLALTALFVQSCKKSDSAETTSPKNAFATIWAPQKYDVNLHYGGEDHKETLEADQKDYLSLKEDGTCNGRLFPLGKFSGSWKLEDNKVLKIENATVENNYLLDDANSFTLDISDATENSMRVRMKLNKLATLKNSSAKTTEVDYTEVGTELFNLYKETLGKGRISFEGKNYLMYQSVVGNQDAFGNKGFFMYAYGRDYDGREVQMFIRHSYDEIQPNQDLVFGSRGVTLLHIEWIDDNGEIIESSVRTFGADGERVSVTSDNNDAFILKFADLTEMDKWNDKPVGNGVKASGYMRGTPVK